MIDPITVLQLAALFPPGSSVLEDGDRWIVAHPDRAPYYVYRDGTTEPVGFVSHEEVPSGAG